MIDCFAHFHTFQRYSTIWQQCDDTGTIHVVSSIYVGVLKVSNNYLQAFLWIIQNTGTPQTNATIFAEQ